MDKFREILRVFLTFSDDLSEQNQSCFNETYDTVLNKLNDWHKKEQLDLVEKIKDFVVSPFWDSEETLNKIPYEDLMRVTKKLEDFLACTKEEIEQKEAKDAKN